MKWTDRQRKCFQRLMSGIYRHRKEKLRFMTLTTSENASSDIINDFTKLRKRIYYLCPNKLIKDGYISKKRAIKIYGINNLDKQFKRFEFLRVRTSEGVKGVLHILYYGNYYPQKWVSDNWNEINGSYIVDIRACKKKPYDIKNLSKYIINQYIAGQKKFVSYYMSMNWCFKGFAIVWKNLYRYFRNDIKGRINYFHKLIDKKAYEIDYPQYILDDFI